jgi:hypothetical protein
VRIAELKAGKDVTWEVSPAELDAASGLSFTDSAGSLKECQIFIATEEVCVPVLERVPFTQQ